MQCKIFRGLNFEVATFRRGRNINTDKKRVATSFHGRDISCKELRSRRHSVVATSAARNQGRNFIPWSRHQMQRSKVATSRRGRDINTASEDVAMLFNGRDIKCKELRSRCLEEVATSRRGCDITTESEDFATLFRGHDIKCNEVRSRRHSEVTTSVTRKEGRDII